MHLLNSFNIATCISLKNIANNGDLHIKQSLLCIHGQLTEGSGLAEILTLNNFPMIDLSVITDASQIKRACYAIQVTVCALFLKLQEASMKDGLKLHRYYWLVKKSVTNQMHVILKVILDLEIQILICVRSQREGNFQLY